MVVQVQPAMNSNRYTQTPVMLVNTPASLWVILSLLKTATTLPCHMLLVRLYLAAASVFVFPCNQRRNTAYPLAVPK